MSDEIVKWLVEERDENGVLLYSREVDDKYHAESLCESMTTANPSARVVIKPVKKRLLLD